MSKRIVAFLLALALCLSCLNALAVDSKTTQDVVTTKKQPTGPKAPTTTQTVVVTTAPTAEVKADLDEIAALIAKGEPVAEYFGEEIAASLGEKESTLKLDEYVPLAVVGEDKGATTMTLSTAASYTQKDTVVVLAGIMVNGKKVWRALSFTIVDGKLVIAVPADIVAQIEAGGATLAILSDKA